MPLIRRIPKRGFNNSRHATRYLPVNLSALNHFDDGARVDEAALRSLGLANGRAGIKILGEGELTKKLTVSAHAFSASAKSKPPSSHSRACAATPDSSNATVGRPARSLSTSAMRAGGKSYKLRNTHSVSSRTVVDTKTAPVSITALARGDCRGSSRVR